MIAPGIAEVLSAVIDTIEREIEPNVADADDGYPASLCRTVGQMLRMVQARLENEEHALTEDNAELRALLADWAPHTPEPARQVVASALHADPPEPAARTADRLAAEAVRLRAGLTALIAATPDAGNPARVAAREYLCHQLQRERAWMVDALTGPRR